MHTVIVEPGGIAVQVADGETIDQALQAAGWYRPWGGCLAGGCGACTAVILESGDVAAAAVTFASEKGHNTAESGQRYVRVCVAVPTSGLSISFRNGKLRSRPSDS